MKQYTRNELIALKARTPEAVARVMEFSDIRLNRPAQRTEYFTDLAEAWAFASEFGAEVELGDLYHGSTAYSSNGRSVRILTIY